MQTVLQLGSDRKRQQRVEPEHSKRSCTSSLRVIPGDLIKIRKLRRLFSEGCRSANSLTHDREEYKQLRSGIIADILVSSAGE